MLASKLFATHHVAGPTLRTSVTHLWRSIIFGCLSFANIPSWSQEATREFAVESRDLDQALKAEPIAQLAADARASGNAERGAIVFFQQQMSCSKCHPSGKNANTSLGPDLSKLGSNVDDKMLVESVLYPSKLIREEYKAVSVLTLAGSVFTGILAEQTEQKIFLRQLDGTNVFGTAKLLELARDDIDQIQAVETSIMPAGQVNQLNGRQQFLDLIRYLIEIRDGGANRAAELQPAPSLLSLSIPEYENRIDHTGFIGAWNSESLARGEAIYKRVCANCHGTVDSPGSLPTSLRFAEGKFKNGFDPLSMYRTLTYGYGFMTAQTWMVPSQKYDVIHYIRETYLKPHNASQYQPMDRVYLAGLPAGDTRGPAPSKIESWSAMDYGPSLTHTYEVPGAEQNFAYKGVAIRLDKGAGGVSRGRNWMLFDNDTLRMAAGWNGNGLQDNNFIDWQGIQFNGAHGVHPKIVGDIVFSNSTGPGWANPLTGKFTDDLRVLGRDGRRYGPLPKEWAKYKGMYHHGQDVVLAYSVGATEILESPGMFREAQSDSDNYLTRTFNIGPRPTDLLLRVGQVSDENALVMRPDDSDLSIVRFGLPASHDTTHVPSSITFDGSTFLEVSPSEPLDFGKSDFSITARIRTNADGTIFAVTQPGPKWVPDGQTFFVRDGRLAYDIGWVGAIAGKTKVSDGNWHDVRVTWERDNKKMRFYVNNKLDGEGTISASKALPNGVLRMGFTAPNFPQPSSFFKGDIESVRLTWGKIPADRSESDQINHSVVWELANATGSQITDATGHGMIAKVQHGSQQKSVQAKPLVAGFLPRSHRMQWEDQAGQLLLRIPAGDAPIRFTLWQSASSQPLTADAPPLPSADRDLGELTNGGPPRWPEILESTIVLGAETGPLASDVLVAPESNPWLAQTRFTGLDFFEDGRIAVCSWDGDVWIVEIQDDSTLLKWRRIATGMFQPLGLRIVDQKVHVMCRDQLTVLHDLNGDGETDFYECLNNDHQVTEHFHEFAMGLQTDDDGNFYYAKSGQHGKPAIVPHHGTLLRIDRAGQQTTILATGFRAANGVCLNPDGSFFVTDQEGFWNPKNRINWVNVDASKPPKFYGNMLGYHDVEDSSDSAMEPPLCWITNAFDRSPGELMWVDSPRWGDLNGSLLNLSYGYGKVFLVPHQRVGDKMQGGMIELPIQPFPTGVMRGRFHPMDHELYLCGMFAWAGDATYPGGLYRLRPTGKSFHLPTGLNATRKGLALTFTQKLDPSSCAPEQFEISRWSLKRTANYGSKHYDLETLDVRNATLSDDGQTLTLDIVDLAPCWCMEIKYSLRAADGAPVEGTIHNTIHDLPEK
jgi:putative heme-binding domain-containing protein